MNCNYEVFSDKVTEIISMEKSKYKSKTSDYFSHIMAYDSERSTVDKIRDNIFHI